MGVQIDVSDLKRTKRYMRPGRHTVKITKVELRQKEDGTEYLLFYLVDSTGAVHYQPFFLDSDYDRVTLYRIDLAAGTKAERGGMLEPFLMVGGYFTCTIVKDEKRDRTYLREIKRSVYRRPDDIRPDGTASPEFKRGRRRR